MPSPKVGMVNAAETRALLVSPDPAMCKVFSDLLDEIGVVVKNHIDAAAIAHELTSSKFEALVLDFDEIADTRPVIQRVRESHSNRNVLVFAVATDASARQRAFELGANFTFERPFARPHIKRMLRTAYQLMLHQRRHYFRCAIDLPVRIIQSRSAGELKCTTINVSSRGMAVSTPSAMKAGEEVWLSFHISEASLNISAAGTVVWDDKHGKAGLSFQCVSSDMQHQLDLWLDSQFQQQLGHGYAHLDP